MPPLRWLAWLAWRAWLALLLAGPGLSPAHAVQVPELSVDEAARRLAPGGYALLIRHATTEPGTGDPPGFKLGDCATQRNLSPAGRAEAAALGQALRTRGLRIDEVRSSAWCRCLETARLAFGEPRHWQPLDSFFEDRSRSGPQTAAVRVELARISPPRLVAMVTHQVNITALLDVHPAQGEAIAVRWRDGSAYPEFRFRVAPTNTIGR